MVPSPSSITLTSRPSASLPLIALGDSITWGYPYGPDDGWVRHAAQALGVALGNHGRNGDTLADLRGRLAEVIALAPHCCLLMGGTNDAALGRTGADMSRDLGCMVEALVAADITPIIGTPIPCADDFMERELDSFRHFIQGIAGTRRIQVVPFHMLFRDREGALIADRFTDATHPSLAGYAAMAELATTRLGPTLAPYGAAPAAGRAVVDVQPEDARPADAQPVDVQAVDIGSAGDRA